MIRQPCLFEPVPDSVGLTVPDTVRLTGKAESPVAVERRRLSEKAARVLARLKETPGQWVSNSELSRPDIGGLGGVRRKWELEQQGHRIEKRKVKDGRWEYRWMGLDV